MVLRLDSNKAKARYAGLMYLLLGICSGFGIMYVKIALFVSGDPSATVANITSSMFTFKLSIVSSLVGQIAFLFLASALYRLFSSYEKTLSKILVLLVVASVPIAFINEINKAAVLVLLDSSHLMAEFGQEKVNSLILFFLQLHEYGIMLVSFFWGLWLLPFGLLILSSRIIPKLFGYLLIIGCFAYIFGTLTFIFVPEHYETVSGIAAIPESLSEIGTLLWLLIMGAKNQE